MTNLKTFEKIIGYEFKNIALLRESLTHASFLNEANENHGDCYERLEFLGDSVLQITVSDYLYTNYPSLSEGKMSQIRSVVVCEEGLFDIAKEFNLGKYIFLSHGEEMSGGREKASILSDALEAVIAAIYLDSDFGVAKNFIIKHFEKYILSAVENKKSEQDYKSRLQEFAMAKGLKVSYDIIGQKGPDHDKTYTAKVTLSNGAYAVGDGSGKKKAEQHAAKILFEKLK